jgi:hypothetical protein
VKYDNVEFLMNFESPEIGICIRGQKREIKSEIAKVLRDRGQLMIHEKFPEKTKKKVKNGKQ